MSKKYFILKGQKPEVEKTVTDYIAGAAKDFDYKTDLIGSPSWLGNNIYTQAVIADPITFSVAAINTHLGGNFNAELTPGAYEIGTVDPIDATITVGDFKLLDKDGEEIVTELSFSGDVSNDDGVCSLTIAAFTPTEAEANAVELQYNIKAADAVLATQSIKVDFHAAE